MPEPVPLAEYKLVKGGVKAHIILDYDDYMPNFVLLIEAKVADATVAQGLALNPGSILVLDRGATRTIPCFARGPARASSSSPASKLTPYSRCWPIGQSLRPKTPWLIKPYFSPAA
ncbi:hypothetical protein DFAR_2800024 [Desulfarculales bacterium]